MEQNQFYVGKKSNFTINQIQFHIETNPFLHWKKSYYTSKQIQFNFEKNEVAHQNKSNFTLKKSNFTFKEFWIIGDFLIMGDFWTLGDLNSGWILNSELLGTFELFVNFELWVIFWWIPHKCDGGGTGQAWFLIGCNEIVRYNLWLFSPNWPTGLIWSSSCKIHMGQKDEDGYYAE